MTEVQPVSDTSYPLDHALVISSPAAPTRDRFFTGSLSPLLISLDPRFTPKRVVLIFEPSAARYAYTVESALSSLGVEVTRWEIALDQIELAAHRIARALEEWGEPLPLCLSAHDLELSMLTASIFIERRSPLLRIHNSSLYRLGARSVRTRLTPRIALPDLLGHLGARTSEGREGVWFEHHLEALSHYLISAAQSCVAPLEVIQRLARDTASAKLLSPIVKGTEVAIPLFQEVLDRFEAAGCLELSQGRLRFSSELHRSYCAGGWLSLYAQAVLSQLEGEITMHSAIQDLKLELAYPHPLEISIPLTAVIHHHLCFFFCVNSESVILDDLFEAAEQLMQYFGASVLMLSVDPLSSEHLERARLLGIPLCVGDELKRFSGWIKKTLC